MYNYPKGFALSASILLQEDQWALEIIATIINGFISHSKYNNFLNLNWVKRE